MFFFVFVFFVVGSNLGSNINGNDPQSVVEEKTDEPAVVDEQDEEKEPLNVQTELSEESRSVDLNDTPGIDSRKNGKNDYQFNDGFLVPDGEPTPKEESVESNISKKRGRGRPKGSKNKTKK